MGIEFDARLALHHDTVNTNVVVGLDRASPAQPRRSTD
jgi:hypothetical protein